MRNVRSRFAGSARYAARRFGSYARAVAPYRRFRGLPRATGLGVETKFFDTFLAASALVVAPASAVMAGLEQNPATVLCLNAPQQGTGVSNREGRFITMESLQFTGLINIPLQADQTAADNLPVIKIWIVLDKQTNGGTATGLDSENVLTNPAATTFGGLAPLRNMLFSKRYKVLRCIEPQLKAMPITFDGTNVEQSGMQTPFETFINLKGLKVEYASNNGDRTDLVDNGLFVIATTSSTTMAPTITYNSRIRFRG